MNLYIINHYAIFFEVLETSENYTLVPIAKPMLLDSQTLSFGPWDTFFLSLIAMGYLPIGVSLPWVCLIA